MAVNFPRDEHQNDAKHQKATGNAGAVVDELRPLVRTGHAAKDSTRPVSGMKRCPNPKCGAIYYAQRGNTAVITDRDGNRHTVYGVVDTQCHHCGHEFSTDLTA